MGLWSWSPCAQYVALVTVDAARVSLLPLRWQPLTRVDSEPTDAQLESCRRATKALEGLRDKRGNATKAQRLECQCGRLHKRIYLTNTG
jgi:hypothetical protein